MEKVGFGRMGDFSPVRIDTQTVPGSLVRARITGVDASHLTAALA
jgi:hypothetical protein